NGLGNKLAGSLAALWGTMSDAAFFSIFVATSIVAAILLRLAVPLIARLTRHAADATTGGAVAATSPAIVSKPL
ncbi:MAG TPA: hypothetical protein VJ596_11465, partial [Gemmatimonadaceae bacterium]|nr:hypothetical protein [Gemmatimonadaceae bacterium]